MHNFGLQILLIALSPFLFLGIWCGVVLLLSSLSGWRQLAERFPARGVPTGRRFRMESGQVGRVTYRNCLTIHASPEGIHVIVWPLFRPGHAPLFIPWSEMHHAKAQKFLWIAGVAFEVGEPSVGRMQLPQEIFAEHPVVKVG